MKHLLLAACMLFSVITLAQNLVSNGSFEDKRGKRPTSRPWRFTNTVDFYANNRTLKPSGTEDWKIPMPRTGKGMVGIRVHSKYREFLQIRLNEKLEEGKNYLFEMYVRSAEHTTMYLKTMGASLYHRKPAYTSKINLYRYPAQITILEEEGITQTDSVPWVKIRGYYRAKGGEKYLSIGNFTTTRFKDKLTLKSFFSFFTFTYQAYYFIDDISLVETDSDGIPLFMTNDTVIEPEAIDTLLLAQDSTFYETPDSLDFDITDENYIYAIDANKKLILEKIRFEFGSDELLPYSYDELELVLEYLNANWAAKIEIVGHTDNVGSESANLKLSEKRAKSVYNYFIDNRIDKSRLVYKGKGESEPISSNEHSAGRNQNRRVEIILRSE